MTKKTKMLLIILSSILCLSPLKTYASDEIIKDSYQKVHNDNFDLKNSDLTVKYGNIKLSKVKIGKWKKISKKDDYYVEYKIKWIPVKNSDGYEVVEYDYDGFLKQWSSFKRKTRKTSWCFGTSRLDTSKVKIKVRAYRYENGKKVYGAWSKVKLTKIVF